MTNVLHGFDYCELSIRDALRDLVPFVQLKKMWKTPVEECYF